MIRRMLRRSAQDFSLDASNILPTNARVSLEQAIGHCEQIARQDLKHFAFANRFIPDDKRAHVWTLYAFAKEAHHAAQSGELDRMEARLGDVYHDDAHNDRDPLVVALTHTVEKCGLPYSPLAELITGFRMEENVHRFASRASLDRFLAHVAHPTARALLWIFGHQNDGLDRYADALAEALELEQMIRDVFIHARRDRIYLPQDDLAHFGVTDDQLKAGHMTPEIRALMRYEVAYARALFDRGRPIIERLGPELGFVAALLTEAGELLLDKVEKADYNVFRRRPSFTKTDVARAVAKAAGKRWPQRHKEVR